ncbi:MAG: hemolysin family protein [Actinobacteria bacterium]|nr:hemolysin family protein [Actinomycetota bacterium]
MNPTALAWMVLLLFANGFFVAAEFAYIAARRNVLEQTPTTPARVAVRLNRDLSLSLAAAQLGITMASLLLGAVSEPAVAAIFTQFLGFVPLSEETIHVISLVIALAIVVFLHMVIGEMAPKNVAIASPERTALALALPFRGFILVFRPLIAFLNWISNAVLRLFRVNPADALEVGHSAEDLAVIIATGQEEGVIKDFAHRLLTGAIIFGDLDASEVMVPRPDVVSSTLDATVAEIEELMRDTGHSRIPVHPGDLDDVVGFVHIKDLMGVDDGDRARAIDPGLIRDSLVVPETARIGSVLNEMRRTRSHLAIVVDEHGSTSGIITMEDIAEELVGEIADEHDIGDQMVSVDDATGRVLAMATVRPDELARFGVELPEGDYETVGGLVMDRLGRLPRRGDIVEESGWRIRVRTTIGRRVGEVEITPSAQGGS